MARRKKSFSVLSRVQGFGHAVSGLKDMLATEPNAWLHGLATIAVLGIAWRLGIPKSQAAFLVLAIVSVWVAEAFNTVLEIMADLAVGERYSKSVKRAKDIAAAAVLVACVGAVSVGLLILGPPLLAELENGRCLICIR